MDLHLGILQTDSVPEQFADEHDDYPQMFRRLFDGAGNEHFSESRLCYTNYDVRLGVPENIICDAYLITGSKSSVYEDLAWIRNLVGYVQAVLDARKKIIGICFGHQLMAHYFGGRVAMAEAGWAVGVHRNTVVSEPPWMGGDQADVALLSSHKDQVLELPDGAELYLSSDLCPIAGFTLRDQVITVQGHPEFDKAYAAALMNMRRDVLGDDIYRRGMASLSQPTGEAMVARWLLEFVTGEEV